MTHYSNKNLRNRSFRKKNLVLTDFHGSDLRGCDFSDALLRGADFSNVKTGVSLRQSLLLGGLATSVFILMADLISRLVFGTLGQSFLKLDTPHVPMLYLMLNLIGLTIGGSALFHRSRLGRVLLILAGILSGAIAGFAAGYFYPSLLYHLLMLTDQEVPSIINAMKDMLECLAKQQRGLSGQTAIAGAILMLLFGRFHYKSSFKISVCVAGCIASYGATFLWGSIAGAYLSNSNLLLTILFGLLTLFFLVMTTISFFRIGYELEHAIGTSFRGADLTHAAFNFADLRNTDFSNTIGYFPPKME
jgi:uncharacterized protein YjbI with pentapeptide repeats